MDSWYLYGWSAWFDAFRRLGVHGTDPWDGAAEVARNSGGWWWMYRGAAILVERPDITARDAQGRLHSETGPAVRYRDGFSVHAWHGTRVPADLIDGGWDSARILSERNAEIRRCAIEKAGWDRFVADAGLKLVASAPDPGNIPHALDLYDLPAELADLYADRARILLCTNGTVERDGTRRRFGLPVPARFSDPVAAAASLYGVTRAEYADLEVRR